MISKESAFKAIQMILYDFSGGAMFLGIVLSMRLIAEEKAQGTIELLFTSPVSEWQVVLGKYFSAVIFLFLLLVLSLPVILITTILGDAGWGQLVSGYLGVLLIGSATIAMGLFYSSLTRIQIVAGLLTAANLLIFLFFGFFSPFISQPLKSVLRELSFYVHYMDFEKGVITTKHVLFFMGAIIFYLYLATFSISTRRFR